MKTTALLPYFGAARMQAARIAERLNGHAWLGIPFAGGMSELAHVTCRTIVVNDLHRLVVNLARVVADPKLCPLLADRLDSLAFHPYELACAQNACLDFTDSERVFDDPDIDAAEAYFVSQWMGRSGQAGTDGEFKGKLPVRWTSSGGDSNTRYRSAVESLAEWSTIMRRCNFTCLDAFEFIGNANDTVGHCLYCDPPFVGPGDSYRHKFSLDDHKRLAGMLSRFEACSVVIRFYDHPTVRELYPESAWEWDCAEGRTQANNPSPEVLLIKKNS